MTTRTMMVALVAAGLMVVMGCGSDDEPGPDTGGGGSGAATSSGGGGGSSSGTGGGGASSSGTGGGGGSSWIFCDDFESSDPVADRYFEFGADDGDFKRVDLEAHSGSHAMEVVFQQGEVEAGGMKVTFGRNPIGSQHQTDQDFDDIYWRMYLKNQDGWTGSPAKLSRATAFSAGDWSQAMIAHLWSSGDILMGDPAGCVQGGSVQCQGYNDFSNLQWLGQMPGTTPIFSTAGSGVWRCIEGHARLNDPGSANGVFEFWIDQNIESSRGDLNWRGTWTAYGINAVFFENYWNNGSPVEQRRYFDDIAIASERIGCSG